MYSLLGERSKIERVPELGEWFGSLCESISGPDKKCLPHMKSLIRQCMWSCSISTQLTDLAVGEKFRLLVFLASSLVDPNNGDDNHEAEGATDADHHPDSPPWMAIYITPFVTRTGHVGKTWNIEDGYI